MNPEWLRTGDGSLLLRFRGAAAWESMRRLFEALLRFEHPGLLNLHPAYASLLIDFDPLELPYAQLQGEIEARLRDSDDTVPPSGKTVEIPVIYDGADLAAVAKHCGCDIADVIHLHSSARYTVRFLGFRPGFPYLDGLPERLVVPRLATPRLQVPSGSVAIAGRQAGIYPQAAPGGWRLLGHTLLSLYPPPLLALGDTVIFREQRA